LKRRIYTPLFLFLLFVLQHAIAQQDITVEKIYQGEFRTERLQSLRSLANGEEYAVMARDRDGVSIDKYSYRTGEKTGTILHSKDLDIPYFSSYEMSDDESKILLTTTIEPIFRRSTRAMYYIYDRGTKNLEPLIDMPVREAHMSPDGDKIAWVYENNIYMKDLASGKKKQVTNDGEVNQLINGVTDWVYEEEFAFVRAYEWSPAGDQIAFISFDERDVPEFSMDVYGQDLYQFPYVFKYPKAGEKNSDVALKIYDLNKNQVMPVDLQRDAEFYIPRIKYAPDGRLSVQVMNRNQNELDFYFVNPDATAEIAFTEKDNAYIDITDDLTFLADSRFLWTSEKDGRRHIYLHDKNGKEERQITTGDWEVTSYYGYDRNAKRIYYQSTEPGSVNRGVYSISLKAKSKRDLSTKIGTNSADFSSDFSYFINTYSSVTVPPIYSLHEAKKGKLVREIKNNNELLKKLDNYNMSAKELGSISINGNDLNMWTMKPSDFDDNKAYPLLMFQYSGPGSQQVANQWWGANDYWHNMLAQQGYIVVCIDGRGTGYKGATFKKMTQNELGKYELEDQIAAAEKLGSMEYIDEERIGIWGWSFGGFMSSNAIMQGAETFSMAIAVAPVTSWRFYDTIYTERYMTTPQANASGYDENSPLSHVSKLEGDYLLIHGSADDNVHVQNTMRLIEALVQANKQFDWRIYPDKNHGIYGGNTRTHLYNLMTDFIKEKL